MKLIHDNDEAQRVRDEERGRWDARQRRYEASSFPPVTLTLPAEQKPVAATETPALGRPIDCSWADCYSARRCLETLGCYLPLHPKKRWKNEA